MSYFWYARNGGVNDFKSQAPLLDGMTTDQRNNRLMPINGSVFVSSSLSTPVIATGRDVGNIGAGYVFSYNGGGWNSMRDMFDAYNEFKNGQSTESAVSTSAQKIGFDIGYLLYKERLNQSRIIK